MGPIAKKNLLALCGDRSQAGMTHCYTPCTVLPLGWSCNILYPLLFTNLLGELQDVFFFPEEHQGSAWITSALTFCGLTNGPSESPLNHFCFKCLIQLWALLWKEVCSLKVSCEKIQACNWNAIQTCESWEAQQPHALMAVCICAFPSL